MGNENAQMDPATAQAVILEGVYVPAFVEKCASLGVNFPDENSLLTALQTVQMLKQAEAEEESDIVKEAHDALVAASGTGEVEDAEENDEEAVEKASAIASNATIKQALATLAQQGE
jgi:hypothetical protein